MLQFAPAESLSFALTVNFHSEEQTVRTTFYRLTHTSKHLSEHNAGAHVRAQHDIFYIRTDNTPPSSRTTHPQMSYVKCSRPGDNEGCWVS